VKVASLDNLLFILLIAVAALFQLLSRAVTKARKRESNETPTRPAPNVPRPNQRAPAESDADRIRKFLEALGQPPSSTPPPPIAPRTDIPPRRLAPVQPPPVIPRAWGLPRARREITQKESPSPELPSRVEKIVVPPVTAAAAPAFEVHEIQQEPIVKTPVEAYAAATRPIINRPDLNTDIASLLASKSGLREAVLLREILGPPRGLQALDATL
jgi:hypothetical protein